MKRIVIDGNCTVVEKTAGEEKPVPVAPVVEFAPPKKRQYVPKQYSPHMNTVDTRYKGGCGGCGR